MCKIRHKQHHFSTSFFNWSTGGYHRNDISPRSDNNHKQNNVTIGQCISICMGHSGGIGISYVMEDQGCSSDLGCWLRARLRCAECGCFPRATHQVQGKWVFPQARLEVRGRRVFPAQEYLLCIGRLLYKLGLSANSQEALSMCMNVIVSWLVIV